MNQMRKKQIGAARRAWILLILLCVAAPFVWLGWKDLWTIFLEKFKPEVLITEMPAGVGLTPTRLTFTVNDSASGIDQIVVRLRQRGRTIELFSQKFKRSKEEQINIELPADPTQIIEGPLELEVGAFDASFWNNANVQQFQLTADYRRPQVTVVTSQHNIRLGGSQLVVYQVRDDNLAVHGVQVGRKAFIGVPLKALDRAFNDDDLYAALFSIDLEAADSTSVKVFAEDAVGNGSSSAVPRRLLPVQYSPEKMRINKDYIGGQLFELYRRNYASLSTWSSQKGSVTLPEPGSNPADLVEIFKVVHTVLNKWSDLELRRHLKVFREGRLWEEPHIPIPGTILSAFGRPIQFELDGTTIWQGQQTGFEVVPINGQVLAANNGIVAFAGELGSYGQMLAIDHGLGLASIYAWLGEFTVKTGDRVRAGQQIAFSGSSGLGKGREYLYQLRLHGQVIDPREWSDKSWYYAHIVDKVNQVKTKFGLPVLVGRLSAL